MRDSAPKQPPPVSVPEWPGAGEADDVGSALRALRAEMTADPDRRAEVERLAESLLEWEASRRRLMAQQPASDAERARGVARKTLVLFDGLPGAGKSTHIERLARAVGALHLSMARFAEAAGVSQDERRRHQLHTDGLHPTDLAFLERLRRHPGRWVILEKFPRTPVEAVALAELAAREDWRLEGVHLYFPEAAIECSVGRQVARGAHRGKEITAPRARRRAMTNLARGSAGRWTLRELGVPILWLDSTRPEAENDARIRSALGLGFDALPWSREALRALDRVSRAAGIEAWLCAGGFYRPFWNGTFGPHQRPTDLDVAVDAQAEVEPLYAALEAAEPTRRWSVLCPSTLLRNRHGIATSSVREAKGYATFLHRAGAVRWTGGGVEVHLAEGAEAALRDGVIRFNPKLLECLTGPARAAAIRRAGEKLERVLGDYPGVRIDPETARLLGEPFETHRPRDVLTNWRALKTEVLRAQGSDGCATFCRRALKGDEKVFAKEILRFHQRANPLPEPPPRPARAPLPAPLEALRRERARAFRTGKIAAEPTVSSSRRVAPPRGYASWLHHLALEADDATFHEWFSDQVHHHLPVGGADLWLRKVLRFELFRLRPNACGAAQSPMHQGWSLDRHLAASVLSLATDPLASVVAESGARLDFRELRCAMRLAVLFHDVGKRVKTAAPRRHARIGARLWAKHHPEWLPVEWVPRVGWMVETHDLFGAFGRGLTEKRGRAVGDYELDPSVPTAYFGALDAQAVLRRLLDSGLPFRLAVAINKAIWCADVGSIAALRWLLPVADLVEALLLAGTEFVNRAMEA